MIEILFLACKAFKYAFCIFKCFFRGLCCFSKGLNFIPRSLCCLFGRRRRRKGALRFLKKILTGADSSDDDDDSDDDREDDDEGGGRRRKRRKGRGKVGLCSIIALVVLGVLALLLLYLLYVYMRYGKSGFSVLNYLWYTKILKKSFYNVELEKAVAENASLNSTLNYQKIKLTGLRKEQYDLVVEMNRITKARKDFDAILKDFEDENTNLSQLLDEFEIRADRFIAALRGFYKFYQEEILYLNWLKYQAGEFEYYNKRQKEIEKVWDSQMKYRNRNIAIFLVACKILNSTLEETTEETKKLVARSNWLDKTLAEVNVYVEHYKQVNQQGINLQKTLNHTVGVYDRLLVEFDEQLVQLHASSLELIFLTDQKNGTLNQLSIELTSLYAVRDTYIVAIDQYNATINSHNLTGEEYAMTLNQVQREIDYYMLANERNYMLQYMVNYRCLFNDYFIEYWAEDTYMPIGSKDYASALAQIDNFLWTKICANKTMFEAYLKTKYPMLASPPAITMRQMAVAVDEYANAVIDYFAPPKAKQHLPGVTLEEWANASLFMCVNVHPAIAFNISLWL